MATATTHDTTLDSPARNTGITGGHPSTKPRPCVATFIFFGLQATVLCDYDDLTSTTSNFRSVDANDLFKGSDITAFVIDHNATDRLSKQQKPPNDDSGTKFLGVEFLVRGDVTQLLGKKKTVGDAQLTEQERSNLDVDSWLPDLESDMSQGS